MPSACGRAEFLETEIGLPNWKSLTKMEESWGSLKFLDVPLGLAIFFLTNILTTAWWLPDDYLTTDWWLPKTARRLPDDCLTTAWRLPNNCLMTAWWLNDDCLTTAQSLRDDCLTYLFWNNLCHSIPIFSFTYRKHLKTKDKYNKKNFKKTLSYL